MILSYHMKSNLYVFILKCVSITSIEHYVRVLLDNKKQNKHKTKKKTFETLYGAAFQFFIQKYYTRPNNTF